MPVSGAGQRIQAEVRGWPGITMGSHRFGGVEFKLGSREIGHVHGDSLVDIPLPKGVRNKLVASGEADPHHVLPESGWVSVYLNDAGDVDRAIQILRRSFEIARQQQERRAAQGAPSASSAGNEAEEATSVNLAASGTENRQAGKTAYRSGRPSGSVTKEESQ